MFLFSVNLLQSQELLIFRRRWKNFCCSRCSAVRNWNMSQSNRFRRCGSYRPNRFCMPKAYCRSARNPNCIRMNNNGSGTSAYSMMNCGKVHYPRYSCTFWAKPEHIPYFPSLPGDRSDSIRSSSGSRSNHPKIFPFLLFSEATKPLPPSSLTFLQTLIAQRKDGDQSNISTNKPFAPLFNKHRGTDVASASPNHAVWNQHIHRV